MVSGYPKSIGISRVDGLSTGPLSFGSSHKPLFVREEGCRFSNYWLEIPRSIAFVLVSKLSFPIKWYLPY